MPMMSLLFSAVFTLSYPLPSLAQEPGPTFENTIVPRQGRLFSIDYTPKGKLFKVSLVGKPIKAFSSEKYFVTAVTIGKDGIPKNVSLMSVPEGYQFKDLPEEKTPIKIKVEDRKTKESEVFLLKP